MATLGFGIRITVTGNFQQGLTRATSGMKKLGNAQKNLVQQQQRSKSIALKQAAAFGLLGGAAIRVGRAFTNLSKKIVGIFTGIVKEAVSFQTEMLKLKVFFGDDAASITGVIIDIAKQSNLATKDVVFIGGKLGQMGIRGEKAAKSIRLVAQALAAQSSVQRTKALGTIANIFQNTQSLARLLNIALSEQEKKAFSAATGLQRVAVVNDILAKRFGNVFDIMGKSIDFLWPQFIQLLQTIQGIIGQAFLEDLRVGLAKIVVQLNKFVGLGKDSSRILGPLGDIIRDVLSPITGIVNAIADLELIPKFFRFLAENKGIVKAVSAIGIGLTALTGVLLTLAGALAIAAASFLLFRAAGVGAALSGFFTRLPVLGLTIKKIGFISKGGFSGFAKISRISGILGSSLLTVLGSLALIAVVGTALAGVFAAAFGPASRFIDDIIGGIKLMTSGIFEVLRTGRISEDLLNSLKNSGVFPFFQILLSLISKVKDFFVGIFEGAFSASTIFFNGFEVFFNVLRFAFSEVSKTFVKLFKSLGFFTEESNSAFKILGQIIGFILGGAVRTLLSALTFSILVSLQAFKLLVGIVLFLISPFQFLFGIIQLGFAAVLSPALLFLKILTAIFGFFGIKSKGLEAITGVVQGGVTSGLSSGVANFIRGTQNVSGGLLAKGIDADRAQDTIKVESNTILDGDVIARKISEHKKKKDQQNNGTP